MIAFPFQPLVVAAAARIWILTADGWAMMIDRAAPFDRIEELAGAFKDVIPAMAEDSSVFFDELGKFALSRFVTQTEAFCQPLDIAFRHDDPVIRAAISRTFGAVVENWQFPLHTIGLNFF